MTASRASKAKDLEGLASTKRGKMQEFMKARHRKGKERKDATQEAQSKNNGPTKKEISLETVGNNWRWCRRQKALKNILQCKELKGEKQGSRQSKSMHKLSRSKSCANCFGKFDV